jgi:hypothetical protein
VRSTRGFHKLRREDRIQQFLVGLANVELITQDLHSSESSGHIYADLERTWQPIGRANPIREKWSTVTTRGQRPSTSASALSASGSQNVISMAP